MTAPHRRFFLVRHQRRFHSPFLLDDHLLIRFGSFSVPDAHSFDISVPPSEAPRQLRLFALMCIPAIDVAPALDLCIVS